MGKRHFIRISTLVIFILGLVCIPSTVMAQSSEEIQELRRLIEIQRQQLEVQQRKLWAGVYQVAEPAYYPRWWYDPFYHDPFYHHRWPYWYYPHPRPPLKPPITKPTLPQLPPPPSP